MFGALAVDGGIRIEIDAHGAAKKIPVLLVLPAVQTNPGIGDSREYDENHLLHIRNDPNSASFVALLPPRQHSSRSVEDSLSDEDKRVYSDDNKYINISIIKTKKMSNFTDFYAFKQYDDVRVRYIYDVKDLGMKI